MLNRLTNALHSHVIELNVMTRLIRAWLMPNSPECAFTLTEEK